MENYIEYIKGNLPIIISVAHGGDLNPEDILDRQSGIKCVDKKTIEIVRLLNQEFINLCQANLNLKIKPSLIISKVSRSKVDLNRPQKESFNHKSELAKEIYQFYHRTIKKDIKFKIKSHGKSLLIDIHGFEKNMKPEGFRDVDIVLGTNNLKSLFDYEIPKHNWDKNIRGAIIERFIALNIPIAPGHPRRKEYVLKGGYITKLYGASNFQDSKAIQIEFSDKIRLNNSDLRNEILLALAETIFLNFITN